MASPPLWPLCTIIPDDKIHISHPLPPVVAWRWSAINHREADAAAQSANPARLRQKSWRAVRKLLERLCDFEPWYLSCCAWRGTLGASGRSGSRLAHLRLPLVGWAEVNYKRPALRQLRRAEQLRTEPITHKSKEGLALFNGKPSLWELTVVSIAFCSRKTLAQQPTPSLPFRWMPLMPA